MSTETWKYSGNRHVAMVTMLLQMLVTEAMAYQATINDCSRDIDGLSWAQYNHANRGQAAQTENEDDNAQPVLQCGKSIVRGGLCPCALIHTSGLSLEYPTRSYLQVYYTVLCSDNFLAGPAPEGLPPLQCTRKFKMQLHMV